MQSGGTSSLTERALCDQAGLPRLKRLGLPRRSTKRKASYRIAVPYWRDAYSELPVLRARFEREARAAAQLKSPHIVQVHDFGFEDEVPYLVMDLLQGEDLGKRLQRCGRLSLPETLNIIVQAGKALRSVHEAGVVHRDLKPANFFLARVDGEDGEIVKLLDFGTAKDISAALASDISLGSGGSWRGSDRVPVPSGAAARSAAPARPTSPATARTAPTPAPHKTLPGPRKKSGGRGPDWGR
ncbi:serine/threonine-protein kinase [Sorangium sp. So ce693]|uniref:serine/threonine-protein kinase n=1 Tax=Sorangium sp. So ce693 TaxID=3133318 RepID=UPI003F62CC03